MTHIVQFYCLALTIFFLAATELSPWFWLGVIASLIAAAIVAASSRKAPGE